MKGKKTFKKILVLIYILFCLILIKDISYEGKDTYTQNEDFVGMKSFQYKNLKLSEYSSNKSTSLVSSLNYTPSKVIPFWFLNGNLSKKELTRQIELMHSRGIKEIIIHPRMGLEQEYLSEEWFYFIGHSLKEIKKRNMKAWIYDDLDWPSGRAGDKIIENNPEFIAKNLKRNITKKDRFILEQHEKFPVRKIVSVVVPDINESKNIRKDYCSDMSCNFSTLRKNISKYVFFQDFSNFETEYSENKYVDLLNPEVTDEFIKLTHEEYYRRFGDYFSNTIIGFFTDEPGFYASYYQEDEGAIPWSDSFSEEFEKEKDYKIQNYLNFIWTDSEDLSKKIKTDYFQVLTKKYSKNYFEKLHNWTYSHNVLLTGHLLNEESIYGIVKEEGDFFAHMEYFDILGTDDIDHFDKNRITPHLVASAKTIYDKPYTLTETFGGYGNNMTYEDMIKVTNWLHENGINIVVVHAFFYSTEKEAQKKDYPPSFFFQNKNLWPNINEYVNYVSSKETEEIDKDSTVVIYPVKEAWEKFNPNNSSSIDVLERKMKQKIDLYKEQKISFILVPDYMVS